MKILNSLFSDKKISGNSSSHWDKAYLKTESSKLGWFEKTPEPSLSLIEKYITDKKSAILNIGSGTTTLIDCLLDKGYRNLIVNDLSKIALEILKKRIGPEDKGIRWIVDDITNPSELGELGSIDLWHDRAVLHFFREKNEQDKYFALLKKLLNKGGYVIISVFSPGSAKKCSGLRLKHYNTDELKEKLGNEFALAEEFKYIYTMPSGDKREYLYAVFRREAY